MRGDVVSQHQLVNIGIVKLFSCSVCYVVARFVIPVLVPGRPWRRPSLRRLHPSSSGVAEGLLPLRPELLLL